MSKKLEQLKQQTAELEKQASQAAVLESSLTAANLKVDELQKENQFLNQ